MDKTRIYKGETYELVGKDYHPEEGEVLYKFDPDVYDKPPLGAEVTRWGSKHHGEEDHYLINVKNIYPQEILDKWKEEMGKRKFKKLMKKEEKRTNWLYLPELYRKLK